jgi:hypothetical protein
LNFSSSFLSRREGGLNCSGGRCDDNGAIEKFKFDRFEDLTPVFCGAVGDRRLHRLGQQRGRAGRIGGGSALAPHPRSLKNEASRNQTGVRSANPPFLNFSSSFLSRREGVLTDRLELN